jgi:cysteine synthase A
MDQETADFVDEVIRDSEQPVVVFALEWCEFCWSVRNFFAKVKVPYRAIDLDSVPYQKGQLGQRIRAELSKRTSITTIPQIFIGGEFVGGCTDVFDAWKTGRIQQLLAANDIEYSAEVDADPYSFLPGWLHRR